MKVKADKSFIKDLSKLDRKSKEQVNSFLFRIKEISAFNEIPHIKKIQGYKDLFRVRLGNYRIGIRFKDETIILVRILNRKDIYKYFPLFI